MGLWSRVVRQAGNYLDEAGAIAGTAAAVGVCSVITGGVGTPACLAAGVVGGIVGAEGAGVARRVSTRNVRDWLGSDSRPPGPPPVNLSTGPQGSARPSSVVREPREEGEPGLPPEDVVSLAIGTAVLVGLLVEVVEWQQGM